MFSISIFCPYKSAYRRNLLDHNKQIVRDMILYYIPLLQNGMEILFVTKMNIIGNDIIEVSDYVRTSRRVFDIHRRMCYLCEKFSWKICRLYHNRKYFLWNFVWLMRWISFSLYLSKSLTFRSLLFKLLSLFNNKKFFQRVIGTWLKWVEVSLSRRHF